MKRFLSLFVAAVVCMAFAFTASAQETVAQYKENSWRYKDGVQIVDPYATAPLSETTHPDGTLKAIDVSHAQIVDWEKAYATGMFDFAMIRCGYAEDNPEYDDKQWEYNTTKCEELGIPYGTYLYSYAESVEDAVSEAQHVLRLVQGKSLSYPVYYDMEDAKMEGKDLAAIATAFCETIEAAGYPVGVYASLYWWDAFLTDECFDSWYRWVAQWNTQCEYSGRYEMWQFTNLGYIDGIERYDTELKQMVQTNVDMNWLIGYPDHHGRPDGPATTGYIRQDDTQYSGMPAVKWTKDNDAEKYEVYLSVNGGDFSLYRTTTKTSFIHTAAKAGNTYSYRVRAVYHNNSKSSFGDTAKLTIQLPAPQPVAQNNAASGKPQLTWDTVEGAAEYCVYRSTSKNGSYKKVFTTTGTTYTNSSATAGTRYFYKVVAAGASKEADSGFSAVVSRLCDLPRPTVTVTNIESTGKIRLDWNAVEGAKEYKVYRSTSKTGTYKLLKTTTDTSLRNTVVNAGETYWYKVRAIHENADAGSAYSTAAGRTVDLPQPKLAVTNIAATGKIRLDWNAVEGAKEYRVYRATEKDGGYRLLKTTTSTTLQNTSINAGETYWYKVRAVHTNSSADSAYSKAAGRTVDLPAPKVTATLTSKGKPRLEWKEVSGAAGYEIYRATGENGRYKRIYTTTGTTFTNTGATAGTKYCYKVRAIHTTTSANSAYSAVKSVKSR
ncbi:MAG: hypothetical protein IIV99_00340 [Oscillospiraceae bacterium]|nr:hypothetical protein [Oscillospiraceae bacterium]